VVIVQGDELRVALTGLTLCGGLAERGGGLLVEGSATVGLRGCRVQGNRARTQGGGLALQRGHLVLHACRVTDNAAEVGGGLLVGGSGRVTLQDCLVAGNRAARGGGLAAGSDGELELRYCTVAGNTATEGGSGLWLFGGARRVTLGSSVLAGPGEEDGAGAAREVPVCAQEEERPGLQPLIAASSVLPPALVAGGWVQRQGGVLGARPRFVSQAPEPWRLAPGSPGRALGQPEELGPGGRDLAGIPRLGHSLPDAGAFQTPPEEDTPMADPVRADLLGAPPADAPAEGAASPGAPAVVVPYASAAEQLHDLLLPVPLLLQRYLGRHWFRAARASGQLSDLFVSLEEVFLRLSAGPSPTRRPPVPPLIDLPAESLLQAALDRLATAREARELASRAAGRRLPATVLVDNYGLSPTALSLVAAAVALQTDLSLYRVAAFAWGDPTLRQPPLGFLVDLVADDEAARAELVAALAPESSLRRFGLLDLGELDSFAPRTPELFRPVLVPDRVVRRLRGEPGGDEELPLGACTRQLAPEPLDGLLLPPAAADAVAELAAGEGLAAWLDAPGTLLLHGSPGVGRAHLATALAGAGGRPAWLIDTARLSSEPATLRRQTVAALREALLQDALPVVRLDRDPTGLPGGDEALRGLLQQVATFPRRLVLLCRDALRPLVLEELPGARSLALTRLDTERQARLWPRLLARAGWELPAGEAVRLTGAYDLVPAEMVRAVRLLGGAPAAGGPARVDREQVIAAVRQGIRHGLGELADRVSTTLSWRDAILPDEVRELLAEVVAYARQRDRVFTDWGFQRLSGGHYGLSVLFSGPPGTGKTMTAALIGADLGREVYRIDLSRVVDKYIGETEKNLARLFDQAEKAQVILLFDEADSLFSSRTQVKSSNDRYANLEVNYLLQRMEAYSGMSILTTNFDMGLDAAFQRRLRFRIGFRMPSTAEREQLWRAMMPAEADQDADIDWHVLAEEFEMAGGNIKNAIVRAAMRAAEAGHPIGFDDVYGAALAEFREMGRLA
jgi:AAA+ superfamily predicted ATPase